MSSFKEDQPRLTLKNNERILLIARSQIKEIFRWSVAMKQKDPYSHSIGESIVDLLKRNLSTFNDKPVAVVIQLEEIKTLLWWQENTQVSTELTSSVRKLLDECYNNIKPPKESSNQEDK